MLAVFFVQLAWLSKGKLSTYIFSALSGIASTFRFPLGIAILFRQASHLSDKKVLVQQDFL